MKEVGTELRDFCRFQGKKQVDVIVVGAGPVGCSAAMAFANRGQRVLVLEASPGACRRFAGEWLHPPGVRALADLGVDLDKLGRSRGYGFVLWGRDASPIELPYVRGTSIARHHHELVQELREHISAEPLIELVYGARFVSLEENNVAHLCGRDKQPVEVEFDKLVGADGRNSNVRAAITGDNTSSVMSYMMGVELKGVRLPHEGLGHVIYGAPGPALFYRIDEDTVRGCLDVPVSLGTQARRKLKVRDSFLPYLPPQIKDAFVASFDRATPWAAAKFRARTFFGEGDVWLAGDAAGHIHPITGMGMTLGILDAQAMSSADTLAQYEQGRHAYIAELLTNVLYQVMCRHDLSAQRVRSGLFEMLRGSASERRRTMRVLTGEDERGSSFVLSFLRAGATSLRKGFAELPESSVEDSSRLRSAAKLLKSDLTWLKWPLTAAVSELTGANQFRGASSFDEPLADVEQLFRRTQQNATSSAFWAPLTSSLRARSSRS